MILSLIITRGIWRISLHLGCLINWPLTACNSTTTNNQQYFPVADLLVHSPSRESSCRMLGCAAMTSPQKLRRPRGAESRTHPES
ncbi:hypothetical protein B0T26DRAFT_720915 [Lasiosphaeria miniovina]|uniref:Secreted protein n=1 Tax=Lasiosphaeria miniovina TaxID=1954250 RepID=A0AA40A4Q4_9PEZI|nr:uncharacterized protein B0T26DRAFT_720915 [Lasiosphaeria miniovina]KAK0709229.1 hypothetical protein B0T26DRAFT_720915 [Lasiosphaeria miniovina]